MKKDYDKVIADHYRDVAAEYGSSPASTMDDEIIRGFETQAVMEFVGKCARLAEQESRSKPLTVLDAGCGNGFTIDLLASTYPTHRCVGVELSDDLRSLAADRTAGKSNVSIVKGDIRDTGFAGEVQADVLICQRVLINLLDPADQRDALRNLVSVVVKGGRLLFLECFESTLMRLNGAREEFGMPAIGPAHHNLYLSDEFFNVESLRSIEDEMELQPRNFLSTHYFVTRVLHPYFRQDRPFVRNSHFVKFFSEAFKSPAGDYAPLQLRAFQKLAH